MARVRTVGTYVPGAVSEEELNARLDRLLQCIERLHPGSVQAYIGGPNPVREVWFTYTLRIDFQFEYQVERAGIRLRFQLCYNVWRDFLERQRRLDLLDDLDYFCVGNFEDMHETVIEFDGRTKRFAVFYTVDGEGYKMFNFVTSTAEGHACFLDSVLGTRFEEALAAPDELHDSEQDPADGE